MKICSLVFSLLFCIASFANAQATDTIQLKTRDTTRLNPTAPMSWVYPRPPIYDTWFKRIVACEGIKMPPQSEIDKLEFMVVNSENFGIVGDSTYYDGITVTGKYLIIVSLPSPWDYAVVAHEFLHFALWYNFGPIYNGKHPPQYFGRCNIRPN